VFPPVHPALTAPTVPATLEPTPPREPLPKLFLRFLRFGALAWGGPVAQIAMIRRELVEQEKWVSSERFNRTLAVYQVLPGPEAHELCVYFGLLAGGRVGGLAAGLGFMLPGLLLMLALSAVYVSIGLAAPTVVSLFAGAQVGVVALVVRAVHRIAAGALRDSWLFGIAALAAIAELARVPFAVGLACGGAAYVLARRRLPAAALAVLLVLAVVAGVFALRGRVEEPAAAASPTAEAPRRPAPFGAALASGLRAGLLTFGGAYTAIPFVRHDAVEREGWLTDREFLDGLALGGILPAPLIIFGTFVGYVAGGLPAALAMTLGIFLPAFAITLVGHGTLERVVRNEALHAFLDGVTAGVVGLIAATAYHLLRSGVTNVPASAVFLAALAVLYAWRSKLAVPAVVLGSALAGLAT
jgi:chromate transporter